MTTPSSATPGGVGLPGRAWRRFRRFPIWGQAVVGLILLSWVARIIVAAAGGDESTPATSKAETPLVVTASSSPSTSPSSSPAVAATTPSAALVPDAPWDQLLAGGSPGDILTAAEAGVPPGYLVDRGTDATNNGKPREAGIRRDLAAYSLRMRAHDRRTADSLGWRLQAIPAAWCAMVLPTRTAQEFDAQLDEAVRRGRAVAKQLDVPFLSPVSPVLRSFMAFARQDAGATFCPEQAANPGTQAPTELPPAADLPNDGRGGSVLNTALPASCGDDFNTGVSGDVVHYGYVSILAGTAYPNCSRLWPSAGFGDCDYVKYLLKTSDKGYVENVRQRRQSYTTAELKREITDQVRNTFDLLEQSFLCRRG